MDFRNMFGSMPPNDPPRGLIGLTFTEYVAGRATFEEWMLAGAKEISDTARKYNPAYLPPLNDRIRAYVTARFENRIEYFGPSALALGEWAVDIRRKMDSNKQDVKVFEWAKQKCIENEILKDGIPNIDYALLKYENQVKPYAELIKAHKVLEMDSWVKIKATRGVKQ